MSYTYDADNRLASVTDAVETTNYSYDPVGNLGSVAYPNGVSTSYTYNSLNRLTSMQGVCGTGSAPGCGTPGTPIASYAYTLGPAGNRLSVAELSGRTVNYGYDDLYRLMKIALMTSSMRWPMGPKYARSQPIVFHKMYPRYPFLPQGSFYII